MYGIDFKNDVNRVRVLKFLVAHEGEEVDAWNLSFNTKVLHYTQAIMELRKVFKGVYNIKNRLEHHGKVVRSFYKLEKCK